eukprot:11169636-Lingulodinium_polyedra.AAC.1
MGSSVPRLRAVILVNHQQVTGRPACPKLLQDALHHRAIHPCRNGDRGLIRLAALREVPAE